MPCYLMRLSHLLTLRFRSRLAALETVAFLVAAPLLILPNRYSPIALVLLPAVWLLRLVSRLFNGQALATDWPFLGLLLMTIVSLYPSVDLDVSRPKFYGLILGFYLFSLIAKRGWATSQRVLAWLLVSGGVAVALAGILGTDWNTAKLPFLSHIYSMLPRLITQVPNSFGTRTAGLHPNEVGGTLALLLPFALSLTAFSETRRVRSVLAVSSVIMFGALILSASRSAMIGIIAAGLTIAILRWPRLLVAVPVIIVAVLGAVVYSGPSGIGEFLLAIDTAGASTGADRLEIWSRAFTMIQHFSFTGIGLNNFPITLNLIYPLALQGSTEPIPHAHNIFLQVALDLGVPGLIAFIALLVAVASYLPRAWRGHAGWEQGLITGLATGLLAHLVYGATDAVALGAKPGLFLWAMLGMSVAMGVTTLDTSRSRQLDEGADILIENQAGQAGELAPQLTEKLGLRLIEIVHWIAFTVACGLGLYMALTGIDTLY